MSAAVVAFGAVSALGEGAAAASAGEPGVAASVALERDGELERAGLARPFAARAKLEPRSGDRAAALLERALVLCAEDLDRVLPEWRGMRIGLAVGTSSGGMRSAEVAFSRLRQGGLKDAPARDVLGAFYFSPVLQAAPCLEVSLSPATVVLGACAASVLAIGLGKRWLEEGLCDLVLAGGFDAVSVFVASGFEALRATTSGLPPRPFRLGRDGMALGEGAAILALAPSSRAPVARAHVTGFGASSDAVHLTAPDRSGKGLARAASAALDEAGRPLVDLVSAHATATPFSDAAEARAIAEALGHEAASRVLVHPFKAQVGHTLGAAGALEALVCIDALERRVLPAAAGAGPMDPDTPVRLLALAERGAPHTALKLSAAFGGANAAIVIAKTPSTVAPRAPRQVYVSRATYVAEEPDAFALAAELSQPPERIARADGLTRLALASVGRLERELGARGSLLGSGILVGEALATLETNALFHARIEERGARMAEPRRFPYTSPNAVAGECSVVFGLTGPGFAAGSGPCAGLEALILACDLVKCGDADRIVVVATDQVGPAASAICERLGHEASSGAVAVLITGSAEGAVWRVDETRLELLPWTSGPTTGAGHRALLALTDASRVEVALSAGGPMTPSPAGWAVRATAHLSAVSLTSSAGGL